jgi:hypothetical protein
MEFHNISSWGGFLDPDLVIPHLPVIEYRLGPGPDAPPPRSNKETVGSERRNLASTHPHPPNPISTLLEGPTIVRMSGL